MMKHPAYKSYVSYFDRILCYMNECMFKGYDHVYGSGHLDYVFGRSVACFSADSMVYYMN